MPCTHSQCVSKSPITHVNIFFSSIHVALIDERRREHVCPITKHHRTGNKAVLYISMPWTGCFLHGIIFTEETQRAKRGPKAVSVVRLRDCWSTIQLRLDHFGASKMFLSILHVMYTHKYVLHQGIAEHFDENAQITCNANSHWNGFPSTSTLKVACRHFSTRIRTCATI